MFLLAAVVLLLWGIFAIPLHTDQWQLWFFWALAAYFAHQLIGHLLPLQPNNRRNPQQ